MYVILPLMINFNYRQSYTQLNLFSSIFLANKLHTFSHQEETLLCARKCMMYRTDKIDFLCVCACLGCFAFSYVNSTTNLHSWKFCGELVDRASGKCCGPKYTSALKGSKYVA